MTLKELVDAARKLYNKTDLPWCDLIGEGLEKFEAALAMEDEFDPEQYAKDVYDGQLENWRSE